jgi:hypothetical protein
MRNQKGYEAGYNGQLVVTGSQVIVGAMLSQHLVDRTLLHPLLDQCQDQLTAAGIRTKLHTMLAEMGEDRARIQAVPRNRERTQEYQRQARHLLMELDPIDVSDTPEAAGEYDCMIGPLLHRGPRCRCWSRPDQPVGSCRRGCRPQTPAVPPGPRRIHNVTGNPGEDARIVNRRGQDRKCLLNQ